MAVVKISPNEREYLTQKEAADFLGFHVNTLVKLSKGAAGPPRSAIGPRSVRYRRSDLVAWMESLKDRQEAA
jgi:predicted DNA-binding transcriptional regulator AlpA